MKGPRIIRTALTCALLGALLFPAAAGAAGARLIACAYSVSGGMENEDFALVARLDGARRAALTVRDRGRARECALPAGTLDELADYLAGYAPADWASLPKREYFALDAPSRHIELTYDDGATYALSDDRAVGGPIFAETERFLMSYLAEGAEVFELTFSSFEGGGPEYRAVLSAPEKVRIGVARRYDEPDEPQPPGSAYTQTMTFYGRVPGCTELTVEVSGPLTPVIEGPKTVYVLEVDDDFNVRLVEEKQVAD